MRLLMSIARACQWGIQQPGGEVVAEAAAGVVVLLLVALMPMPAPALAPRTPMMRMRYRICIVRRAPAGAEAGAAGARQAAVAA